MATNSYVEIDIPEAADLADLTGITQDFVSAKRFAQQLEEMLNKENPEFDLIEPMTSAILVRYSRPFTTGVRQRLGEKDLESLSPKQRKTHKRFRLWRDKHIAHSVNVFEENQPVARYWVERVNEEGFTSVECNMYQLIGFSSEDISMAIDLTTHFIECLKPQLKREKEKVLAIVRSLPKEQILAMKKPMRVRNISEVGKTRKK